MEYCSSHYGMPQFFSFDSLKLIQGRISNGGYARSGVSLVDEQDFTAQNLHDSDKGAIPGEVMIHEMFISGGDLELCSMSPSQTVPGLRKD